MITKYAYLAIIRKFVVCLIALSYNANSNTDSSDVSTKQYLCYALSDRHIEYICDVSQFQTVSSGKNKAKCTDDHRTTWIQANAFEDKC